MIVCMIEFRRALGRQLDGKQRGQCAQNTIILLFSLSFRFRIKRDFARFWSGFGGPLGDFGEHFGVLRGVGESMKKMIENLTRESTRSIGWPGPKN